jgi:hypothetical protein
MVGAAQMKNLLLDFRRGPELRVSRARLAVDESLLAVLFVCSFPLVEDFSGDAKIAAGMRHIAGLLGVVKYAQLSSDIVLSLSYSGPPVQKVSPLEISCQPRSRFSNVTTHKGLLLHCLFSQI